MAQKNSTNQDDTRGRAPYVLLLQPKKKDSERVINLVRQAIDLELPDAILKTIDDLYSVFKSSPEIINNAVSEADVIIGDMEGGNQSVLMGLGVAVSKNKPVLLIAPAGRALVVPTGLFNTRLFLFSFDEPDLFIESFGHQVKDALERASSGIVVPETNTIFVSYSHRDTEFLDRLIIHLRPLNKAGLIKTWADTHLRAGDLWQQEIEKALERARAAILLVSADFMASEFIVENELPPLLAKAEAGGTRIIPVIVKPCRFTRDKHLSRFQSINDPRKPLISLPEAEREEIYDKVAMEVE